MRFLVWAAIVVALLELAREAYVLGTLERPAGPPLSVHAMPHLQAVSASGAWDVRESDNFGLSPVVEIDCRLSERLCRETTATDFGQHIFVDTFDYSIVESSESLIRYANVTECVSYAVTIDIPTSRVIATRSPTPERPASCSEPITVTMELADGVAVAAERRRIEASRQALPLLGWMVP